VQRLPVAWRQCLCECIRRAAWADKYANAEAALAEKMGRLREDEVAKRDKFLAHVERYVPNDLLAATGLLALPALCQVNSAPQI
jgi:hypothetical protein